MIHESDEPKHMLSPRELAQRLGISEKKLAHDRSSGCGVLYLKIGRLVRYRLFDVLVYEAAQARRSTSDKGGEHA